MLGPRYVETSQVIKRERQRERDFHLRRLQAIESRSLPPHPAIAPKTCPSAGFLQAARQDDIRRENKALFAHLLAISQGKRSLKPVQSFTPHKSLHSLYRKREDQKIAEENSLLAQRIISQSGFPSAKQLTKAYESIQRYRSQLSRIHASNPRVSSSQSRSPQPDNSLSRVETGPRTREQG